MTNKTSNCPSRRLSNRIPRLLVRLHQQRKADEDQRKHMLERAIAL